MAASPAELDEAEALHRKALEMNRRIRPDHPYLADNLAALGYLRHLAHDEAEAEPLVREALRIYRLKLPEEHSKIVDANRRLALILVARGRPREAEPLLLECYRVLAAQGESPKDKEAVRKDLVLLYGVLGKPDLAARYRATGG